MCESEIRKPLQWRHNGRDSVSNHQPHDCFLNRLFRRRSKKTSKLRVAGLCAGNSPGTGEFPAQMNSNAENVSIWWRHHAEESFLSSTHGKASTASICKLLEGYFQGNDIQSMFIAGFARSAFSWYHSSVFHYQWTHNQVFLLLAHNHF